MEHDVQDNCLDETTLMAMARRYTTLRKKVRELEAKVVELLTLPPETPHHDLLSDGVEQRLDSLKALVSAEMASHPSPSKPAHLLHITDKLSELEVAFREWDHCRSAVFSGVDDECSCGGESGINDDDNDDDDDEDGDINMEELGFKVYDVPKELREDDGEEEEKRFPDGKTHHVRRPPYNGGGVEAAVVWDAGKYYRVWATGAVLGAFSMAVFMARFSACFYVIEYLGPLTPT